MNLCECRKIVQEAMHREEPVPDFMLMMILMHNDALGGSLMPDGQTYYFPKSITDEVRETIGRELKIDGYVITDLLTNLTDASDGKPWDYPALEALGKELHAVGATDG